MPPSTPPPDILTLADLMPAFITASAAIVIAAIVAPAMQARARRNERWEKAVSEMSALVDSRRRLMAGSGRTRADRERPVSVLCPFGSGNTPGDGSPGVYTARSNAEGVGFEPTRSLHP